MRIRKAIFPITLLEELTNTYPNPALQGAFLTLQTQYKYYRAVLGDGNCFYRAFIFQYLSEAPLDNYTKLFPQIENVCKEVSLRMTGLSELMNLWKQNLLPIHNLAKQERENRLELAFNQSQILDFLLICYFRSLNHKYIKIHQAQLQNFSAGPLQDELERVATYGAESQGIQLVTLGSAVGWDIGVWCIDQNGIKQLHICENKSGCRLLYRPGHYDILYKTQYFRKVSGMFLQWEPQLEIKRPKENFMSKEKNEWNVKYLQIRGVTKSDINMVKEICKEMLIIILMICVAMLIVY